MSEPSPTVPVLETARLRLRGFGADDIDAHAAILAEPAVMRFLGHGQPYDRYASWTSLAGEIGHWALRGYGTFAVEALEDSRLIGRVGLWNPDGWPGCELAWTLSSAHWGKGYATEAATAARDWAFGTLGLRSLCHLIHRDNAASKRVAAKLGARQLGQGQLMGNTVDVWRLDRTAHLAIAVERPDSTEALALLDASDALSHALYPPESNHLLDPRALAAPEVTFLVARLAGRAVGCAALVAKPGYGEIKRMFVDRSARGQGVGAALLRRIEALAAEQGLDPLHLETGIHNHEALRLYRRHGFTERCPFAGYGPDPLSVFMEKPVGTAS